MDSIVLRIDQPQPGGSYRVTLTRVPGNELLGDAEFPPDLALPGMANPMTADQMRQIFLKTHTDSDALPAIGAQLYALIGQGALHARFDPNGEPWRLLLDIQPPDLRNLPWELLRRDGFPLFYDEKRPICRVGTSLAALPEPEWPLRILIVDGGELKNKNDVQAEAEIVEIIQAINEREADIDLLVLKRPTSQTILEAFEDAPDSMFLEPHQGFKPHILHFIGHGDVIGNQAYLQLWNESGDPPARQWLADDIRTNFARPNKPRLVILNSCKTDQAAEKDAWSVTQAFREAGVPAVIGMRNNVTGRDAQRFSAGLYQALARGAALDQAMSAARRRVYDGLVNAARRQEWAAPTLEVSADPNTIIKVGQRVGAAERARIEQMEQLRRVRGLADRFSHRWSAWRNVAEERPEALRKVLIMLGDEGVGKTSLARMIMKRCALCGHQLRYVDMTSTRRIDALAVLRRICDGDGDTVDDLSLTSPLSAAAFATFKDTVQMVLGAPLAQSRLTEISDVDERRLFGDFQAGLEQAIATPPLVIVLDHLKGVDEEQFQSFLVPHLITWCANRPNAAIRLVLLLTPSEYERFGLGKVESKCRIIGIEEFDPSLWTELATEFVRRNLRPPAVAPGERDPQEALYQFITSWGEFEAVRWKPERLDKLLERAQRARWTYVLA
jgi:hypothetical protein